MTKIERDNFSLRGRLNIYFLCFAVNTESDPSVQAVKISCFEIKFLTQTSSCKDGSFCIVFVSTCVYKHSRNINNQDREQYKRLKLIFLNKLSTVTLIKNVMYKMSANNTQITIISFPEFDAIHYRSMLIKQTPC